jgi:Fe-Mn family superoxide dismutase
MERNIVLYQAKDYTRLLGMNGFSDILLNNHFKLYQGYVKNVNLILDKLTALLGAGSDRTLEYAELKRRFGWEFNGMRLHEFYFENLGVGEPIGPKSPIYKKITEDFGSFDIWKQDFISTGVLRGIGWVVLCLEPSNKRLINVWINEHDVGHIAGAAAILVMDVFEHAYFTDYQLDRSKYIEVFFDNINWSEVSKRII